MWLDNDWVTDMMGGEQDAVFLGRFRKKQPAIRSPRDTRWGLGASSRPALTIKAAIVKTLPHFA